MLLIITVFNYIRSLYKYVFRLTILVTIYTVKFDFTAPGILHQVLVVAENNIGSGPAVIQEFYTEQLSKQLFITE